MLNSGRLQNQLPFFEKMNKLGYIITQLDLQHSAGWVGSTGKEAAHENNKNRNDSEETVSKSVTNV